MLLFRQKIARELFHGKLIKGHVAIECIDHPVSPSPHFSLRIDMIAMSISKSGGIQPINSHPLSVMGRSQQPFDDLFVGIFTLVRKERVNFFERRWKPGQIERHASNQSFSVRFIAW